MKIPDFSIPTDNCFLTFDKNGEKIKEGDTLVSTGTYGFTSFKPITVEYKVTKYQDKLVVVVRPSYLLSSYVKTYCHIKPIRQ